MIAHDRLNRPLKEKVGASDVVQESIVQAQLNFGQFQGSTETEFKAWLKQILINEVGTTRRRYATQKRAIDREAHFQQQSSIGVGPVDPRLTPQTRAVQDEREALMLVAIERLPDDQRRVIQLRNLERLSFGQIGREMDRSEDAARKLWARAIFALKSSLREIAPETFDSMCTKDADE